MRRRLADALDIVVAGGATAEDRIVIHLHQRDPGTCTMTIRAKVGREDMVDGLGGCADSTTDRVAADAVDGRALKHAADMTAFAVGRDMCAVQREACCKVIEVG